MKKMILFLVIISLMSLLNNTKAGNISKSNNSIEENEIKSFNDLIGTWQCKSISRNHDGSWRTDTVKATWVWFYILNGEAVQDIFYAGVEPGNIKLATFSGTNIRIYNPKDKIWNMAWFDTNNRKIGLFTALGKKDTILMVGKNALDRSIRNVFSDISKTNFTWTQFWTFDSGKTWIDVSKIWCNKVSN